MSKGKCSICGVYVGGFFNKYKARRCTNHACGRMFCRDCCDEIGFIFKTSICPKCGNTAEDI